MSTSFEPLITVRPRSLDETIDLALTYLRNGLSDFAPVFFWVTLLSVLPAIVGWTVFELPLSKTALLLLIFSAIIERIVTLYGSRHLFGAKITLSAATQQTIRHLPLAILTVVTTNLPWILIILDIDNHLEDDRLTVFGVLLVLMWPILIAPHFYLREVTMLEQVGLSHALRRARDLMWIRMERVFAVLFLTLLIRMVAALLVYSWARFLTEFILQFSHIAEGFLALTFAIGWSLAGQFLAVVRLFDYVDARTRREGWDIQIRFDAIRQRDEDARNRRIAV